MGRAGRAARLPTGEGAGNLSRAPRAAPQPGLPVPSILILPPGSRCAPPRSPLLPVGAGGATGPQGDTETKPGTGQPGEMGSQGVL